MLRCVVLPCYGCAFCVSWRDHATKHRTRDITPWNTERVILCHETQNAWYHATKHRTRDISPRNTERVVSRHETQKAWYHATKHRTRDITPRNTEGVISRHETQNAWYHATKHRTHIHNRALLATQHNTACCHKTNCNSEISMTFYSVTLARTI